MIKADRELLARLRAVNQAMGEIGLRLLPDASDESDLTASDLRRVANGLQTLASEIKDVAAAMTRRADEVDQVQPVTSDALAPMLTAGHQGVVAAIE